MKLFSIALFLSMTTWVFGQTPDNPRTIFELYNLSSENCPQEVSGLIEYAPSEVEEVDELIFEDMEIAEESYGSGPSRAELELRRKRFQEAINNLPKRFETNSKWAQHFEQQRSIQQLKSGNYCFREKGLWGLKNAKGKVLIAPKFQFIQTDTFLNGFVGFAETNCNYYDGKKGKPLLKSNYYSINVAPNGSFIVQTKTGYGVISRKNKWIIRPDNIILQTKLINDVLYYFGTTKETKGFIKTESWDQPYFVKGLSAYYNSVKYVDDKYLAFPNLIINLKTKKQLICENGFYLTPLSPDAPIASIQKQHEKKVYLIDFEGNLINSTAFEQIDDFDDNGIGIITIKENPDQPNSRNRLRGLINSKGEIILEPIYDYIWPTNGHYLVRNKKRLTAIIDRTGKIVIPFQKEKLNVLTHELGLIQKGALSQTVNLNTGQVIKDELPYPNIQTLKPCSGNQYFKGRKGAHYYLLDEQFNIVVDQPFSRLHIENNKIFAREADSQIQQIFDCEGKPFEVEINGKKHNRFERFRMLGDGVIYIALPDETAWFVCPDGSVNATPELWNYYVYDLGYKDFYVVETSEHKKGIVNLEGKIILEPIFEILGRFKKTNIINYRLDKNNTGYFNQKGAEIFKDQYDDLYGLTRNLVAVRKEGLWGLVNLEGQVIVPREYYRIELNGGLIIGKKRGGGNTQFYDYKGNLVQ